MKTWLITAPCRKPRGIRIAFCGIALALLMPLAASAQIDINRADARTLAESMSGVGLVKAEAIVAYRTTHGPFHTIEELSKVDGIGARTIAANRAAIVIIEPAKPAAKQAGGSGKPFASH